MLPNLAHTYLTTALEGTPQNLNFLLSGLQDDDQKWDFTPDPERFTLREIVAHLTSIEPSWTQRALQTLAEENPNFPRVAIQNESIASNSPQTNLQIFGENRAAFVEIIRQLTPDQWQRAAHSEMLGALPLESQAVFVLAHDGYHLRQIVEWLQQIS